METARKPPHARHLARRAGRARRPLGSGRVDAAQRSRRGERDQRGHWEGPLAVPCAGPGRCRSRRLRRTRAGACMLGAFEPIVRGVADKLGAPYTSFPFAMFAYGAGGVAGWGTLCGCLNGAAAALAAVGAAGAAHRGTVHVVRAGGDPGLRAAWRQVPGRTRRGRLGALPRVGDALVHRVRQEVLLSRAVRALRRPRRVGGAQGGDAAERAGCGKASPCRRRPGRLSSACAVTAAGETSATPTVAWRARRATARRSSPRESIRRPDGLATANSLPTAGIRRARWPRQRSAATSARARPA